MANKVQKGNLVSIQYVGTFDSGEVFDSNKASDGSCAHPLQFIVGSGMVIPGFDKLVEGLEMGQEKTIRIEAKDAYGEKRPELTKTMPKPANFPSEAKEGMMIGVGPSQDRQIPALITKLTDKEVTLDLNHPLAGKALNFAIKILDIKEGSEANFMHDHEYSCGCDENGKDEEDECCGKHKHSPDHKHGGDECECKKSKAAKKTKPKAKTSKK